MTLRPMPVVMISSLTQKGAATALRALELGAIDFVAKPMIGLVDSFATMREEIVQKVKQAACARVRPLADKAAAPAKPTTVTGYHSSEKLIAIGASTGGVEALHTLLSVFPSDAPAILVAQHMPPAFTAQFAAGSTLRSAGLERTTFACCIAMHLYAVTVRQSTSYSIQLPSRPGPTPSASS